MIRLVSGRAKPNRMLRAASQARTERLLLDAESAAQLRHKLALRGIGHISIPISLACRPAIPTAGNGQAAAEDLEPGSQARTSLGLAGARR